MADTKIAYLAGVFDGEGTIGFYWNGKQYVLSVAVTMCCVAVLEAFVEEFGGKIYPCNKKNAKRPQYTWQLRAKKAEPFMSAVLPYLIEKREQVELGMEIRDFVNSKKGLTHVGYGRGSKSSDERKAKLIDFSERMKSLKVGG